MSGSTHPRLISEWSAEMDLATGVEDLDHSGFIFDKHQIEFATLESIIATGIMKDSSSRIQEEDQFLRGNSIQEEAFNAYGQTNHVSNILVLQHQEHSGAYDELE